MKFNKRILSVILALVCFCSMFSVNAGAASSSSGSSDVYDTYTLYCTNKTFYAGDTVQLILYYPPTSKIKWYVSDSSIAAISTKKYKDSYFGQDLVYVTFGKAGTLKVKAVDTTTGETVVKKQFKANPYVSKIKFKDGSSYAMKKGDTATLRFVLKNAKGEKITVANIPTALSFTSATSNKNIVKIKATANGKVKVKAVGKGTAKVRVKAKDGSGATATIKITVT